MAYIPLEDVIRLDQDRSSFPMRDCIGNKNEFSINMFPESLIFEGVIGTETDLQTILINNNGYNDVNIQDITIVGPFSLKTVEPTKILVNETVSLSVAFTARHTGNATGGLHIKTVDAVGDTFISFSGSGLVA